MDRTTTLADLLAKLWMAESVGEDALRFVVAL
jgi:hypothetical protein